jgi:dihydroorotate dehydrogenase (NAD+) catalytic subunit
MPGSAISARGIRACGWRKPHDGGRVKAKRRAITASPRAAEQRYPTAPKRPVSSGTGRSSSAPTIDRPGIAQPQPPARVPADSVDLRVDLGRGLVLPNPILVASGTFGYGVEYGDVVEVDRLGGICCKGTTLKPRIGNPTPRVTETPGGMLNSIGLQNPGVDAVVEKYAETWTTWKTPVIVNVAGESVHDYVEVTRRLDGVPGVAAIELNISCPNVGAGGLQFAIDAGAAAEVTAAVRRATDLPLLVKLSPNVADIRPIARAIADAGADALTAINTLSGIAVAPGRERPLLGNIYGGLSGPAVKPVALRVVYEAAQAVRIPVVAIGGVTELADVLDFLAVGAVAVQVGTAIFADPTLPVRLVDELAGECGRRGLPSYGDLIGTALPKKAERPSAKGVEYRP